MAEIHPFGDRLKVLPLRPAAMTKGGILMPQMTEERERPKEGLVLKVGRGRILETGAVVALESNVGDVVQFGKYAGVVVFDEEIGHDVLLMREDEALGRKLAKDVGTEVAGDPRLADTQDEEAASRLAELRKELVEASAGGSSV